MSDYLKYDEEQFFYEDTKKKPIDMGATNAIGDLLGSIVGVFISLIFTLLLRVDLVSSGLLGLMSYLLTYKKEWPWYAYVIGVTAIVVVSLVLQHAFIIARIIYGD